MNRWIWVMVALFTMGQTARAELQAADAAEVAPSAAEEEAQRTPAVAFGGAQYLVVWQAGIGNKADLRAGRVDAAGASLDGAGFSLSAAVSGQHHPEVAYSGDVFFVVWADLRNGKDYDVYGARVDSSGKVLDTGGLLIAGGVGNQARPHLTATPSGFFVVWEEHVGLGYAPRGVRVGLDGKVLDTSPIVIFDAGAVAIPTEFKDDQIVAICQKPRVALVGDQLQVAWIGADKRIMNGRYHVMGARLKLDGTLLDTARVTLFLPQSRVFDAALVSGGGKALVSWTDLRARGELGGDGNLQAVGSDGQVSGPLITLGVTGGRVVIDPSLAYLGSSFAIAFVMRETEKFPVAKRRNRLALREIDSAGASAGDDLIVGTNATTAALASDGAGKALLVYIRLPSAHGERPRVVARLVTKS